MFTDGAVAAMRGNIDSAAPAAISPLLPTGDFP
jgi:hypothetical protein